VAGASIVIDLPGQPDEGYHSIAAYYAAPVGGGAPKLWLVYLRGDGAYVAPLDLDIRRVNRRLVESGELCSVDWLGGESDILRSAWEPLQLLVATSWYLADPSRIDVVDEAGPPARRPDGKALREAGRVVPAWRYQTTALRHREPSASSGEPIAGRDGLTLQPTVVSPHIRYINGEVRIIDAYDSTRWRADPDGRVITHGG
jgi:hypothetical protein